jgi:hypothetical protein
MAKKPKILDRERKALQTARLKVSLRKSWHLLAALVVALVFKANTCSMILRKMDVS